MNRLSHDRERVPEPPFDGVYAGRGASRALPRSLDSSHIIYQHWSGPPMSCCRSRFVEHRYYSSIPLGSSKHTSCSVAVEFHAARRVMKILLESTIRGLSFLLYHMGPRLCYEVGIRPAKVLTVKNQTKWSVSSPPGARQLLSALLHSTTWSLLAKNVQLKHVV